MNTSTSPKVQYAYADGSSNHARRLSMNHPDNTRVDYQYGGTGSADDVLNRVAHLQSGTAIGVGTPVICGYSCEPSVQLTYFSSGGSGDAATNTRAWTALAEWWTSAGGRPATIPTGKG